VTDQEGALLAQSLGDGVDAITGFGDRGFDGGARLGCNVAPVVKHAGDSGGGDPGASSDVFEGGVAPGLWFGYGHR